MNPSHLFGLVIIAAPLVMLAILGISAVLLKRPLTETAIGRIVQIGIITGFLASLGMLAYMLVTGTRHVPLYLGDWVHVHSGFGSDYHFSIKFLFDRLSIPFVILTFVICGTVGAFANRYMHREPGFGRFFFLYAMFVAGMIITATSGTIETLFTGWELVGLSSALLVAFFHERVMPCRNGLRVWTVYRFADAALLLASVVLHHLHGHGDFDQFLSELPWPAGVTALPPNWILLVGGLLLIAAAGKSALLPFSGWLPRAMEGPTPSSAVFYGALSVHLGAFLLLRMSPLLDQSPLLCVLIVLLGLLTAAFGAFAGRVQTDVKSALSFAALTQVGLIVAEIGVGLRYIALIHIIGHACLRTLQFIRAPSMLYDLRNIENALGQRLAAEHSEAAPTKAPAWVYRLALERGYMDALLDACIAGPFVRFFSACQALETRWTKWLAGPDAGAPSCPTSNAPLEDLL
ncbi:proton-conducting transporter membrane subunit [Planctomyces sp. SH-PL14]|uniref:proton-conducting transporter transmembrane domain-containing protein n=1 Tax=Planctomyces sp. SH-PL14 TaxID=1632864 RepID=UPI00078E7C6D|nr:proton-conducting transporter membrane subunit [Planctomyces sp. SH-PL14]AMV22693.1 NADH-quinone oxidoreductase subunit 12 [Planctomyces sp. SH-PL14]